MLRIIQLIAKDKTLYYPETVVDALGKPSPIVLCIYDAGDCDTICWPHPNLENLKRALFDDRECGVFDDIDVILLPDNTEINF